MKTVLITGATGFLGSNILSLLISSTKYNVIVLKRASSDLYRIKDFTDCERIKFFDIDYKNRAQLITKIFKENKPDAVIHTATSYGRKEGELSSVLDTNLTLPIEILKAAASNNTRCFINTDSYYNKFYASYSPLLDYSLSKHSFSLWLRAYSHRIQGINVMLEHIYGKDDSSVKFTEYIFREIITKKSIKVDLSPGDQKRDFIYVKDAASAYISILENALNEKFDYKEFDLGTGKSISIREFVEKVKEYTGGNTKLNFGAFEYRKEEIMCSTADIKALENIGWQPSYTLEKAIGEIADAYK